MAAIFKHKGKLIQAMNLAKKLKKMKIAESDIEVIWEGEADQASLEKRFNKLNLIQKNVDASIGPTTYRVYSDTIPPVFIKEVSSLNELEVGKYQILILQGELFNDYVHYEKTETLN